MENVYYEVGRKIRDIRKQKKMSAEELGKKIGKSKVTITRYEKGELKMNVDQLKEMAKALSVDASYLMGLEPDYSTDVYNAVESALFNEKKDIVFTNDEMKKIIEYADYILSKRG